jgi:hypothetical protein
MRSVLQTVELFISSFLFAFIVANLIEIWYPKSWLISSIISFIFWFVIGLRYFKLKNEMMNNKPQSLT